MSTQNQSHKIETSGDFKNRGLSWTHKSFGIYMQLVIGVKPPPTKTPLSKQPRRGCLISPTAWRKFDAYVDGHRGPSLTGSGHTWPHGRGPHGVKGSSGGRKDSGALKPQQLTALIQGCMHAWEVAAFVDQHGSCLNEVREKYLSTRLECMDG